VGGGSAAADGSSQGARRDVSSVREMRLGSGHGSHAVPMSERARLFISNGTGNGNSVKCPPGKYYNPPNVGLSIKQSTHLPVKHRRRRVRSGERVVWLFSWGQREIRLRASSRECCG
jgi:hypothetical protein